MGEFTSRTMGNLSIKEEKIPDYWKEHIDFKIETIKNNQEHLGVSGTSFGFITDIHINDNSKQYGVLLEKILTDCDIKYFFHGGDILNQETLDVTIEEAKSEIRLTMNLFKNIKDKMIFSVGNHDDNSLTRRWSGTMFKDTIYNEIGRACSIGDTEVGPTGLYIYRDDKFAKIRYISLDTADVPYIKIGEDGLKYRPQHTYAICQEQMDWFINKALKVPSDEYSVVLCTHVPLLKEGILEADADVINGDLVLEVLKAFNKKTTFVGENKREDFECSVNVDFSLAGGKVICTIAGHTHTDCIVNTPQDIKIVTTMNDGLHHTHPLNAKKILGTDTEGAFDIFTVDTKNQIVKITRVGAGKNREFTY